LVDSEVPGSGSSEPVAEAAPAEEKNDDEKKDGPRRRIRQKMPSDMTKMTKAEKLMKIGEARYGSRCRWR